MRDLTEGEIREYLDWAKRDLGASDFNMAQASLIGTVVREIKLMDSIASKLGKGLAAGIRPEDAFLSLWISAFQMGRECESRLLTRALQKGAKA